MRISPKILSLVLVSFVFSFFIFATLIPVGVSAHEVYVLPPAEIQLAEQTPTVSPLTVIRDNLKEFSFWAFVVIAAILCIFFISITRRLEKKLDPFFIRTKHWAPLISRVTVGLSFIAAAFYQASYGPELPLSGTYGEYAWVATIVLAVIGLLITLGFWSRLAAAVALVMFGIAVYHRGWYMLTYTNYLGEILTLLIIGAGHVIAGKGLSQPVATHTHGLGEWGHKLAQKLAPYSFLVLRVLFGFALIYTSVYAKLWYSNLALDTVNYTDGGLLHPLTYYLHFEPHFLVLGAALIEIVIGLFFVLGIEIRFTAIFLNFWLILSLIHFGEIVWPHIILIGIPIAFFFYGYDKYSLEGYFFKKGDREPVL